MSKTHFSLLRSLNGAPEQVRAYSGGSHVFPSRLVEEYFSSGRLTDRFIRELVFGHVIKWKEILECFEFFDQTRKYLRRSSMVDVCCGHGLVGILFALLEKEVEQVRLTDTRIPASLPRVLETAIGLGAWVEEKVQFSEAAIGDLSSQIPRGTAVLSVHGCGGLTDQAIELAMGVDGPVAVMPCCCHPRSPDAPEVLYRELGVKDGVDVHRTYRLNDAGYQVLWRYIPEDVTPMNRIILGAKRPESSGAEG